MDLTKRELRQRSAQLNDLLHEWDPIGRTPRDEYNCLVGPLLTKLQAGASEEDLTSYLRGEIVGHFGLSGEECDFPAVAKLIHGWFDRGWRERREMATIFVALLNEAVDVWRPVQARPLAQGLFRIVGVECDVSDETWQFP